jgi:hypothetical protein
MKCDICGKESAWEFTPKGMDCCTMRELLKAAAFIFANEYLA